MSTQCIAFCFAPDYDVDEAETLLQLLTDRGAIFRRKRGGGVHLYVPLGLDPDPFLRTIKDSPVAMDAHLVAWLVPIDFKKIVA